VEQAVEELDGRAARHPDVLTHAAAGIEEQADMERRLGALLGVAAGEVADFLLLAALVELEIGDLESVDRRPLLVHDREADVDDVDPGPEGLGRHPDGRETNHCHEWRSQPNFP
jgi:hypothetical protein